MSDRPFAPGGFGTGPRPRPDGPRPPFWGTRQFRWLAGSVVLAAALVGIVVFELGPRQRALLEKRLERFPAASADLPALPAQSRLPVDPALREALATAVDPTPVDKADPAYRAIIGLAVNAPPAVVAEEAAVVAHGVIASRSSELRGRALRITAMLLDWKHIALVSPVGDVEFIYRAFLLDPSGDDAYVIDLLEEPAGVAERDLVRTEAFYLRQGSYETRDRTVSVPQLVGRAIRPVERAVEQSTSSFQFLALGLALSVLAVALLVLTFFVQRRALHSARRTPPRWPAASPANPEPAPWEGFVDRAWKAAAAPTARPGWIPRRRAAPVAAPGGAEKHVLLRVGLWLVIASLACVGLGAWTVYRVWRDAQPVVIDFAAESEKACRDAEAARDTVRVVQERIAAAPSGEGARQPLADAAAQQELARGLRGLERAAERLQELLYRARGAGYTSQDPTFRRRGLDFARLGLWILDASDLLKRARGEEAPEGFFVPYLRLERARARLEVAVRELAPGATPAAAELLLSQSEGLLRAADEIESYLKAGLGRDSLEPADVPELACFQAERNALEQHRRDLNRLLANP